MKRVYVFNGNENGMVELSAEELERIIRNAYDEGYREGYTCGLGATPWYYKPSPTITPTITCDSKTNPYKITFDGGADAIRNN